MNNDDPKFDGSDEPEEGDKSFEVQEDGFEIHLNQGDAAFVWRGKGTVEAYMPNPTNRQVMANTPIYWAYAFSHIFTKYDDAEKIRNSVLELMKKRIKQNLVVDDFPTGRPN